MKQRTQTDGISANPSVCITPLGIVDETAVSVAAAHIQMMFNLSVDIEPGLKCPEYTALHARCQYDAARLVEFLAEGLDRHTFRLGLTGEDISLPFLTYVYGEALIGGTAGVISTCRLEKTKKGAVVRKSKMYERLAKVSVHETGHLLGLLHCSRPECVMNFSAGLDHLDCLTLTFCSGCLGYLGETAGLTG